MLFQLVKEFVPKWGHAIVLDELGGRREYALSLREVAKALEPGYCPSCCTEKEWLSGKVTIVHRVLLPGEACIGDDGRVYANFGIQKFSGGNIRLDLRSFPLEACTVSRGVVSL